MCYSGNQVVLRAKPALRQIIRHQEKGGEGRKRGEERRANEENLSRYFCKDHVTREQGSQRVHLVMPNIDVAHQVTYTAYVVNHRQGL